MKPWTTEQAIALATAIEPIAARNGAHVALSGGLLYKQGPRKDCDLVFYRHRQAAFLNKSALLEELRREVCLSAFVDYGFCVKADWWPDEPYGTALAVDLLFPEVPPSYVYPGDATGGEDAATDADILNLVR